MLTSNTVGVGQNQLVLAGVVVKAPRFSQSPAGIHHLRFVLEHRSEQVEAKLPRRSYVRIAVVLSGEEATQWRNQLDVGSEVQVSGFLNREEDKNGIGKLVLHVQQLVKI